MECDTPFTVHLRRITEVGLIKAFAQCGHCDNMTLSTLVRLKGDEKKKIMARITILITVSCGQCTIAISTNY